MPIPAHAIPVLLAIAAFVGWGCGNHDAAGDAGTDGAPVCGVGFLGSPALPIEMRVVALGADNASREVSDGASLALIFPPQGGRVAFAGVRATNLDPCAVKISGALRDLQNQAVRVDARTVNLLPAADGWGQSDDTDISTFANIPLCPNEWSTTNLYGTAYDLIVTLTDKDGRTATKTTRVTPACAEPARAAECMCICKKDYVLGEACDAGAADVGVE